MTWIKPSFSSTVLNPTGWSMTCKVCPLAFNVMRKWYRFGCSAVHFDGFEIFPIRQTYWVSSGSKLYISGWHAFSPFASVNSRRTSAAEVSWMLTFTWRRASWYWLSNSVCTTKSSMRPSVGRAKRVTSRKIPVRLNQIAREKFHWYWPDSHWSQDWSQHAFLETSSRRSRGLSSGRIHPSFSKTGFKICCM